MPGPSSRRTAGTATATRTSQNNGLRASLHDPGLDTDPGQFSVEFYVYMNPGWVGLGRSWVTRVNSFFARLKGLVTTGWVDPGQISQCLHGETEEISTLLAWSTRVSRRVTRQGGLTWLDYCFHVNAYKHLTAKGLPAAVIQPGVKSSPGSCKEALKLPSNLNKYRANYSSSFHVISQICSDVGPSRQPLTSFWNYTARKQVCSIPTCDPFVPLGMKGIGSLPVTIWSNNYQSSTVTP